jgi:hypothetical protein
MRRTEVLDGVRMLKFRDVFGRCEQGRLSKLEAAELLQQVPMKPDHPTIQFERDAP